MIREHRHTIGTRPLCDALGEPRSSWYRSQKPPVRSLQKSPSPRRLCNEEQEHILTILNSERFRDVSPAEVYTTLLDEGHYLCSERTMYRILARHQQNGIRWQRTPHTFPRPELLASQPNELWSWDITKLKSAQKWTYYYLYKIMDVFSRYVVGWMVAYREKAFLAEDLIADTCLKQCIQREQLTIHADRGSAMISNRVGQLLMDLGVVKTHSRPHVSNDNPYSESAFKTLKYRPDFPEHFGSIEDARAFCLNFFHWYNNEHRHSGIAMLTPASIHYATHTPILDQRKRVLKNAFLKHPERFVKGSSIVKLPPEHVWINKPVSDIIISQILS